MRCSPALGPLMAPLTFCSHMATICVSFFNYASMGMIRFKSMRSGSINRMSSAFATISSYLMGSVSLVAFWMRLMPRKMRLSSGEKSVGHVPLTCYCLLRSMCSVRFASSLTCMKIVFSRSFDTMSFDSAASSMHTKSRYMRFERKSRS